MAWNGSGKGGTSAAPKKPVKAKPLALGKGAIAGVLVVVAAALAAYFLLPGEKPVVKAEGPQNEKKTIATVTPEIKDVESAGSNALPEKEATSKIVSDIGRQVTNSFGKVYTIAHVVTSGVVRVNGEIVKNRRLFTYDSECVLDSLLTNEPGLRIYGSFNADQFDQDFANSVGSKIEVTEEDSEYEAERKRMVMDAKQMLIDELKAGRKPSELIVETRREINKLADMRDDYAAIVAEMQNNGASDQEIEDYYEAVNQKFAEHDIPPLLSPAKRREKMQLKRMLKAQGLQ